MNYGFILIQLDSDIECADRLLFGSMLSWFYVLSPSGRSCLYVVSFLFIYIYESLLVIL